MTLAARPSLPGPTTRLDKPHEECGVVAVLAPTRCAGSIALDALAQLQHRGQESAGLVCWSEDGGSWHDRRLGLVADLRSPPPAELSIGHTRYSTVGPSTIENCQPYLRFEAGRPVVTAHNGTLTNGTALRATVIAAGETLASSTDSEAIGSYLVTSTSGTPDERVRMTVEALEGAYALVLGWGPVLYLARDPHGVRPLAWGHDPHGSMIVSSETRALVAVGCRQVHEVGRGELYRIDHGGTELIGFRPESPATCAFEHAYFLHDDSVLDGQAAHETREQFGRALAGETSERVEVVVGVPRSGLAAARGYARAKGLPLVDAIVLSERAQRSFIEPTTAGRQSAILSKFLFVSELVVGRRVALVDDTIVRGNTLRDLARRLADLGATEVHARIASPPVVGDCHLGVDIRPGDGIAARGPSGPLAAELGCSSIQFLSRSAFGRALPGPGNCLGCFGGGYADDRSALQQPMRARTAGPGHDEEPR